MYWSTELKTAKQIEGAQLTKLILHTYRQFPSESRNVKFCDITRVTKSINKRPFIVF